MSAFIRLGIRKGSQRWRFNSAAIMALWTCCTSILKSAARPLVSYPSRWERRIPSTSCRWIILSGLLVWFVLRASLRIQDRAWLGEMDCATVYSCCWRSGHEWSWCWRECRPQRCLIATRILRLCPLPSVMGIEHRNVEEARDVDLVLLLSLRLNCARVNACHSSMAWSAIQTIVSWISRNSSVHAKGMSRRIHPTNRSCCFPVGALILLQ